MFIDMLKAAGINTELSPDEKWIQGEVSSVDWVGSSTAAIATIPLPCKPIELWCICINPTSGTYQTIYHYIKASERVYGQSSTSYLFWTNGYAISDPDSSPQVNYVNRIYEVTDTYFKLKYENASYASNNIVWLARIPKDTSDSILERYACGENVAHPSSGTIEIQCGFKPKKLFIHQCPESGKYRHNVFYDEATNEGNGRTYCVDIYFKPDGSYYSSQLNNLSGVFGAVVLTSNGFTIGTSPSSYSQHFDWEAWG